MAHTIEVDEFDAYKFEQQMAASFGIGENKELKVVVDGLNAHYEVWSNKALVEKTTMLDVAVASYNDA